MRDLVYDDTRWVKKLRSMGCWNEAEARASVDPEDFDEGGAYTEKIRNALKRTSLSQKNGSAPGTPGVVLTNTANKSNTELLAEASADVEQQNKKVDGFAKTTLSPKSATSSRGKGDSPNPMDPLNILQHVRSVRGRARQEYGKVYGALRPFYRDAIRTKNPSSAKIFRTYRDPKQQAQMLVQLQIFAKSDSSPGEAARDERLNMMIEAFEDAVANEFEIGLEAEDVDGRMKKYAGVLVVLNGGKRAVNQFLAQNELFKNHANLGDPSDCIATGDSDQIFLHEIHAFCSHLASAFNHQLDVMNRAFPPSVDIFRPFLARLGDSVITPYVNQLIDLCHQKSTEAYLRATSSSFQQLVQCSRSLKFPSASRQGLLDQFDEILSELYTPHFSTYLAAEIMFFRRGADDEVRGWERQLSQQDSSIESLYMANVNRQADKRDFLSSFRKVVMAPVNALPSLQMGSKSSTSKTANGSDTPSNTIGSTLDTPSRSSTPASMNRASRSLDRPPTPLAEPPTTELAAKAAIMKARLEGIGSLFSLEMALSLVHLAKASIERLTVFTLTENDFAPGARGQAETIFTELVQILGDRHVRSGFDKAVEHLGAYNPRDVEGRDPGQATAVGPLAQFLELVNVGDLIQQMLDVFFEQELVAARLTDKQDFMNPTVKGKKKFEQMLDERVAAGLNQGIEVLVAEVDYQLATTQKAEDFNPDATGDSGGQILDIGPSETARNVVDLVSSHTSMLVGSTEKTLLDVFNQEVGLRLYNSFCKHLKRQRVSVAGSIRLIR
jgi:recyclin-1